MKAKIISFDEVVERIKSGNVKNIYIIDILSRFIRKVSDVEVEFLMQVREDSIFIHAELGGEWYGVRASLRECRTWTYT